MIRRKRFRRRPKELTCTWRNARIGIVVATIVGTTCFYTNRQQQPSHHHIPWSGCSAVQVWSHRTHTGYGNDLSCRDSLERLHKASIRRFDVDVLLDGHGRLMVAHPSELPGSSDVNFQKAPCSNIELHEFFSLLHLVFDGDDKSSPFFVTMEPKANWPSQTSSIVLGEPNVLMDRLLAQVTDLVAPPQCGIILSELQLQSFYPGNSNEYSALFAACHHLVFPLSIRSPFHVPIAPPYTMFMPTIEHHVSLVHETAMELSSLPPIPTVVWIVDDHERLTLALQIQQQQQNTSRVALQGIITNRPLQMQDLLRKICRDGTR
jgi:hypothetical protein